VLIDAGCGVDKFQNTNGRLLGHLASAGYAPGDIDMILFTHCHFDHLWGISDGKNASLLFPSAEFVASETEVAFWSDPELPGKVSAKEKSTPESDRCRRGSSTRQFCRHPALWKRPDAAAAALTAVLVSLSQTAIRPTAG
jgi:glyoxylase-like metal-dependent hydrolase (beta-lactamase superfamily II)